MEGSKEWFIRMREEEYSSLPYEFRERFLSEKVIYPEEHKNLWDSDMEYRKIYKIYNDAKKALEEYKFKKRYANSRGNIK